MSHHDGSDRVRSSKAGSPSVGVPTQAASDLHAGLGDRLISVVLFGSRARDEATEGSDWDLLVIAEGLPESLFQRRLSLKRMLSPACRGAISILARTPQEFESHLSSLSLDIALDGQIIYDPRGYAARQLSSLRNSAQRAGLSRNRTEAGDVWEWQTEPVGAWDTIWRP